MEMLELSADAALFGDALQGIAAVFYENERPLQGLAGLLDWRFQGAISHFLKKNSIQGREGECAYLPLQKNNRTTHLILVGGGVLEHTAKRGKISEKSWQSLRNNLLSLRLTRLGISQSDCGSISASELSQHLQGVSLCIVQ